MAARRHAVPRAVLVIAWLAACATEAPQAASATCDPAVDWASFGEGWFATWCTACHSASLTGEARGGAPEGLDFDRWESVVAWSDVIATVATGDSPTMPPGGGPPIEEREQLAAWLACGAPGTATDDVSCASPRWIAGDRVLAEGDDLCVDGNAVRGTLEVTGGRAGCLCAVEGDLLVSARAFDAPRLTAIGGDLAMTGGARRVHLPALESVGGDLRIDAPELVNGAIWRLATVGGDVIVQGTPAPLAPLDALATIGGGLTLADLPVTAIDGLQELSFLGGPLVLDDLPALTSIGGFRALPAAPGLALSGLPVLTSTPGFTALSAVDGEIALSGTGLTGAGPLGAIAQAGAVRVIGNPDLTSLQAFGALESAAVVEIRDNPALPTSSAEAFAAGTGAGETIVSGNGPG